MRLWSTLSGIALLITMSGAAQAQSWAVGQEREVDEGVYARLFKQENGWRVWRFETKDGVTCKAVKSAKGRAHPVPVGVGFVLFQGTPFVQITFHERRQNWTIEGAEQSEQTKFRLPGEKFWQDWKDGMTLADYDGKAVEFNVSSWKHPKIYVGNVEERAILDLTGLGATLQNALDCAYS